MPFPDLRVRLGMRKSTKKVNVNRIMRRNIVDGFELFILFYLIDNLSLCAASRTLIEENMQCDYSSSSPPSPHLKPAVAIAIRVEFCRRKGKSKVAQRSLGYFLPGCHHKTNWIVIKSHGPSRLQWQSVAVQGGRNPRRKRIDPTRAMRLVSLT